MITNARSRGEHTHGRSMLSGLKRKAAAALVAATAVTGIAIAVPAAASAGVSYGETAQFHCSTRLVTLDNIRMPYAEVPVAWPSGGLLLQHRWHLGAVQDHGHLWRLQLPVHHHHVPGRVWPAADVRQCSRQPLRRPRIRLLPPAARSRRALGLGAHLLTYAGTEGEGTYCVA